MPVITTRVPDKMLKDVEEVEKEEQTDRAQAIRKLLAHGIKEWKLKKALDLLREHKVSYRKAAEIAGVSYMEMWDLSAKHGIDIGYTVKDLKRDVEEWLR